MNRKEVIDLNNAEIALELLKIALDRASDAKASSLKTERLLDLYEKCRAAVCKAEREA